MQYEPLPLNIPKDTGVTIGLFGSSKQGKTTALVWLWNRYFRKKYVTILCSPHYRSPIYDTFRTDCIITPNYDTCKQLIRLIHQIQIATNNKFRFLVILDDIVAAKNDKVLRELILTMRNSDISTILCVQGQTLVDKNNRTSLNICFFFHYNGLEGARDVINRFLEDLFSRKGCIDAKARAYQYCTKDHHFIVRDQIDGRYAVSKIPQMIVEMSEPKK